ncbi:MAG TPA: hypothetical protein VN317_09245 [Candidatus Methanoperedens sp.]|nr:hypothetical protein [Candidatus Methanoperedens sp.]
MATGNTGEWGRSGAVWPPERFADRLRAADFERVEIRAWWERFDLVWAAKPASRHDQAQRCRGAGPLFYYSGKSSHGATIFKPSPTASIEMLNRKAF